MCTCVCVCVYICVYTCVYVCTSLCTHGCISCVPILGYPTPCFLAHTLHECVGVYTTCLCTCVHMPLALCMRVCQYLCVHVPVFVCLWSPACTCVCLGEVFPPWRRSSQRALVQGSPKPSSSRLSLSSQTSCGAWKGTRLPPWHSRPQPGLNLPLHGTSSCPAPQILFSSHPLTFQHRLCCFLPL